MAPGSFFFCLNAVWGAKCGTQLLIPVMPLQPPRDFAPVQPVEDWPSQRELYALWIKHVKTAASRQRESDWRRTVEHLRRAPEGELCSADPEGEVPAYVSERLELGPYARKALRPIPRTGRVMAAGVDTWSLCWYAADGSPLHRAMSALATERHGIAWLIPGSIGGYRVGWFRDQSLVFAEGRPCGSTLAIADELPDAALRLDGLLRDLGIPVEREHSAGLRRLDVAVDVWLETPAEGLIFLEAVGASSLGSGKLVVYRSARRVESVLVQTRAGRTKARLYDKGAQTVQAPVGRWLRLEAQWRFPLGARPAVGQLPGGMLRDRFRRRFDALWQAAEGLRFGGFDDVAVRLAEAIAAGRLPPSRARSIAGYLVLRSAGVDQGATRTQYELDRDCRELGLAVATTPSLPREVDAATILDECLAAEVWG
jgi:hypothetical protein